MSTLHFVRTVDSLRDRIRGSSTSVLRMGNRSGAVFILDSVVAKAQTFVCVLYE